MTAYILRRLLVSIPVVLGVAFIILMIFNFAGGDPVDMMMGKTKNEEAAASLKEKYGLDKPLLLHYDSQYTQLLVSTVTFDFGDSYSWKRPVRQIFMERLVPTLMLSFPAFLTGALVAIVLSLFVAFNRGTVADFVVTIVAIGGISISSLLYILYGQAYVADQWKLFPVWGFDSEFLRAIVFVALPVIIWIAASLGADIRYFRTVVLDQIRQDYVRTARSIGHSDTTVLFRHVLRNCWIPILTRLIIQVPFLITGSFLLEVFFGIPGLGNCLFMAISNSDFPILSAFTMLGSLLYIFFNLLSDVAYAIVDPRVRLG